MTTEEIVKAAREAGFGSGDIHQRLAEFKRLIESAAAAEREACAKVCESYSDDEWLMLQQDDCAAAIRARCQV